MKAFEYVTAASPASARSLLGDNGRYISGGIDLLGQMKDYLAEPKVLVNVKALPGLDKIEPGEKLWTIGANVTISELEDHDGIKKAFPGLQQAAADFAFFVMKGQERLNFFNLFRAQPNVRRAALFPGKGNWPQVIDDFQAAFESLYVCFVAQTG